MARALGFLGGYIVIWALYYLVSWRLYRGAPRLDVRQIRLSDPRRAHAVAIGAILEFALALMIVALVAASVVLGEIRSVFVVQGIFLCVGLFQSIAAFVGWRFGIRMVDVPRMQLVEVRPRSTGSFLLVIFCAALTVLPVVLLVLEF